MAENPQEETSGTISKSACDTCTLNLATLTQMQNAVAARIFVLARTTDIDTRYTNDKTYSISNAADFTPNDSFHRRVFSTSVTIQNTRSITMMNFPT